MPSARLGRRDTGRGSECRLPLPEGRGPGGRSLETTNEIEIAAPPEAVFALAAATERWAEILPHYRRVRRLRGDDRDKLVEMAATRDFGPFRWPVRWTARQHNDPDGLRITFKHVRGISRGMDVEWRLTRVPRGTRVRIWHEFNSSLPLVGGFFARRIVGQLFVGNIAGKTLRRMRQLAETRVRSSAGERGGAAG